MSPFNEGGQFAWDSTSLQWFMDCPWKYKALMIDGWAPRRKSVHLLWGGWYASALEHFHRYLAEGMDREDALRKVVRETLEATWEYERCPACEGRGWNRGDPKKFGTGVNVDWVRVDCVNCENDGKIGGQPWVSDHASKTRENLIRTIVWYVDHFDPDPLEVVILPDGRPAVEYSFSLELDDGLVYCGHIDRLVLYSGDIYVQDQKTTQTTVGPYYFDNYDPDVQMTGYAFAASAIMPQPVKGVIIDAAQVAVGFSRFERGFTHRTPAKLQEWYQDTLHFIGQARQMYQEDRWPRNRTSCGKFGGCMFRAVCSRSPEVREQFLKADFEKRENAWNPLEKR